MGYKFKPKQRSTVIYRGIPLKVPQLPTRKYSPMEVFGMTLEEQVAAGICTVKELDINLPPVREGPLRCGCECVQEGGIESRAEQYIAEGHDPELAHAWAVQEFTDGGSQ